MILPFRLDATQISKWRLFSLLGSSITPKVIMKDGRVGILQGIIRESGSGSDFNLRVLLPDGLLLTEYISTFD